MAEAVLAGVFVFTEELFWGLGSANVWMVKTTAQLHAAMREHAPVRTGELRASINSEVRHIGSHVMEARVGPTVPHGLYVLRGTGYPVKGSAGEIFTRRGFANREDPDNGWVLLWGVSDRASGKFTRYSSRKRFGRSKSGRVLGKREQHWVRRKGYWLHLKPDGPYKVSVRGQRPNNFILAAYTQTRMRHRALPEPPPGVLNP